MPLHHIEKQKTQGAAPSTTTEEDDYFNAAMMAELLRDQDMNFLDNDSGIIHLGGGGGSTHNHNDDYSDDENCSDPLDASSGSVSKLVSSKRRQGHSRGKVADGDEFAHFHVPRSSSWRRKFFTLAMGFCIMYSLLRFQNSSTYQIQHSTTTTFKRKNDDDSDDRISTRIQYAIEEPNRNLFGVYVGNQEVHYSSGGSRTLPTKSALPGTNRKMQNEDPTPSLADMQRGAFLFNQKKKKKRRRRKTPVTQKKPNIYATSAANKARAEKHKQAQQEQQLLESKAWWKPAIWDVNGPPVRLVQGESVVSTLQQQQQRRADTKEINPNELPLLTAVQTKKKDTTATTTTTTTTTITDTEQQKQPPPPPVQNRAGVPLHAYEVLQCRQSVTNFVINATDGKDECDGLIKAFDKTCRADDADEPPVSVAAATKPNPAAAAASTTTTSAAATANHQQNRLYREGGRTLVETNDNSRGRRRRKPVSLWDKTQGRYLLRLKGMVYQNIKSMQNLMEYWIEGPKDPLLTFVDDEIVEVWDDAQYLVENDLVRIVYKDVETMMNHRQIELYQQHRWNTSIYPSLNASRQQSSRKRRLQQQQRRKLGEMPHLKSVQEKEGIDASARLAAAVDSSAATEPPAPKPANKTKPVSLHIPTKSAHLSEQNAAETLLLQQGDKIIQAAANQSTTIEQEEANAAKRSISETSNAINAIFNDPTSIEARMCCASILNVYHELCSTDEEENISDSRLFFCVMVMAACGIVKSLIRHYKILWMPEAAGCILVGVACGYIINFFPHHDISFDGNWFLRILVPPIIFEAALSIDKKSFNRHLIPIIIYSVAGTIVATLLTAIVVHYGTGMFSPWCIQIPFIESLTFGALISSIDPIAVLSVLSNMGMTDTDTVYVLVFGESLLNDGVAIVLFHTLVHFLDENLIIDQDAINAAGVHFFVVAFGSLLIGVAAGVVSTVYFWVFHGCQTPLVEVIMFFCWALIPYYVCDGIGWSGIVAAVAVGFFMDVHIVGIRSKHHHFESGDMNGDMSEHSHTSYGTDDDFKKLNTRRRIFNPHGHLSAEARAHIGFVTEIVATGMETAIFAYLGFFLFSHRYHWNVFHIIVAILACCLSRAMMIPSLGMVANWVTRLQQHKDKISAACSGSQDRTRRPTTGGVFIDRKMQIALWIAGIRGAMSFALVEHIPLYDSFSGEGTRLKPELKAMTSASILFTVFVLGGSTYYMMQHLGIAPQPKKMIPPYEIITMLDRDKVENLDEDEDLLIGSFSSHANEFPPKPKPTAFRRQPHAK